MRKISVQVLDRQDNVYTVEWVDNFRGQKSLHWNYLRPCPVFVFEREKTKPSVHYEASESKEHSDMKEKLYPAL